MSSPLIDTDVVSLSGLRLAATIESDHWHRIRPQPIQLSLHLHLTPLYLNAAGRSDDVTDSLHYGHLAKAVERRVDSRTEKGYAGPRALVEDVTDAAFEFVRDATGRDAPDVVHKVVHAIRVVLSLPKQILLAGGFEVELTTSASDWTLSQSGAASCSKAGAIVRVTDMVLPVLIGVNPPERLSKQRIITDITFFESTRGDVEVEGKAGGEVDYAAIVQQIATDVERSAHLTLEKLVYEIIQTAYRARDAQCNANIKISRIEAIAARCRKPSALSFADASGVEMTRTRRWLSGGV